MVWFVALLMLPGLAWAQGSERDRLVAERQGLLDRYAAEERACRERFVVTACVDGLRARRRLALQPLRERELALDDAERRQRASDRRSARLARPQRSAPLQAAPASAAEVPVEAGAAAALAVPPGSASVGRPDVPHAGDSTTGRALQAAERARAAAKRAAMLEAAPAEVARRQAQRAASGKAALPLPVPP